MKVKIKTGGGMRGVIKYISKDDAEFISGTQSAPNDFLRETAALRELRPDIKKPVFHMMLSQPPGESLSMQQWREVIEKQLHKLGLENQSYYAIKHNDADHENAHVVINLIRFDGQRWNSQNSAKRAIKACEEIEAEMGLTKTRTLADYRKETGFKNRGISTGAMRQFERTGTLPSLTKQAITRRKAAENERDKQNRAACDEPTTKRTTDVAADRPVAQTDIAAIIANKTASRTTEHRDQDNEHEHGDIHKQHQTDQRRLVSDAVKEQTTTEKNFQITEETTMQKQNGGQVQAGQIDDEDTPPTLGGRLRAKAREEAGKHIYDLYFQDRSMPTFAYHCNDRKLELLAKPTPENVAAFFDCCEEKGMKPLRLFGNDQFLQLAVAEAQKRGYPLDMSDPRVKAMHDQIEAAQAPASVVTPALSSTTPASNMFAAVADRAMQSAARHLKF